MNYRNPALRDRLASEYVLGTLAGRARNRFEALMRQDDDLVRLVHDWEARLQPLADSVPAIEPSAAVLENIERQLGFSLHSTAPTATANVPPKRAARPTPERTSGQQRLSGFWQRLFAPIPIGALAMGLVLGMMLPGIQSMLRGPGPDSALLPASYVGVLADAQGRHGLAISSLRHGKVVEVKQLQPVQLAPGQTLFLWSIDKSGEIRPVGPLPNSKFGSASLPDTSERLFADVRELAVSVESVGQSPGKPQEPFLFRGLCGKFWR